VSQSTPQSNGQDPVDAKKEVVDFQNKKTQETESLRKAFNDDGQLSRGWMREILDVEDLEQQLQPQMIEKIQGLINKQWMLANLTDAETHDRIYKLDVMKIKLYGEAPPEESELVGPIRAVVYDDPGEDIMPLTSAERNTIDQIIMTLQNMTTRSRGGFEREQIALTHTGRLGFGTLDSSLMHNTTETIGRTIPGTIGAPTAVPGATGGDPRELETTNLVFDTKLVAPIGESHIATVGGQWWKAEMTDGIAQTEFEQKTWALFAEDEWRLRDDLALTLGARYDDHESFGGHVSPRAYLVWNTTDSWTLKGGISKGYKTPDLNDLHGGINGVTGQGTIITIGNPDLDPETTTSTEFGAYFDSLTGFSANATLFHNKFKDKIASGDPIVSPLCAGNTNGTCSQQINVDEAVTRGLELAGSWQFAPAWKLSANYTYTDSEQKSGDNKGEPLTNTPEHLANAKLDWQTTDHLGLWLKSEYRGERARFTSSYANLANANGSYSTSQSIYDTLGKNAKAYTLFHLGGSYRATENLTLNATIYNLFDKDFVDGKAYTTYSNGGSANGTAYGTDYSHSGAATTGLVEEGRRLWLSANLTF